MRLAIVVALVCVAAGAFGAPTMEAPKHLGGGRSWVPLDDPDLEVKWVQTPVPYPYGNGLASQEDVCYPFFAQMADDFLCEETGSILAVEWWGTYWNPGPDPPPPGYFFVIEFWTDNGLPYPNSHPQSLIYQQPCFVFTEDYDDDYQQYHYVQYLDFPFEQVEGNIYWISIYAYFCFPPQYGWCTGEPQWNDCGNFYSPFFGFPQWTSSEAAFGDCLDMAFVLYGSAAPADGALDIKPTSCPNPLNLKSKGVLPAAILGTADFDVTLIDVSTVLLEGVAPLRSNLEDVSEPVAPDGEPCECTDAGPDGFTDLTLKFKNQDIVEALGDVDDGDVIPLTVTGELLDGTPFEFVDCVWILDRGRGPEAVGDASPVDAGADGRETTETRSWSAIKSLYR